MTKTARLWALAFLTSAAFILTPQDSEAQSNAATQQTYTPDYFSAFQPNTASDMVGRIPGFSLQGGNNNGERGFGQASLNILINGRRPSSKSSGANEILGRIPADKVERIEILDGASLDIPGLSGQVANIITKSGSISGNWRYAARFAEDTQPQWGEGEISVSGSSGRLEYVASIESDPFRFREFGDEQFLDAGGSVFEDRAEDIYFYGDRPNADLNLTYNFDNGNVANLNLSGALWNRNNGIREEFVARSAQGETGNSEFRGAEDEYNFEIGGDYAFKLGAGKLKLIGLHRYEDSEFFNGFSQNIVGEAPYQSQFDRVILEGEYIARSEYDFKRGNDHDIQLSLEGAFNFLDNTSAFIETGAELSNDQVRVEEKRAEGFVTHSWAVSENVNVQTSLGAEYSQLEVTTGNDPARKFFRPKGFVSASYDANPRYTWRAKVERKVGQLNFFDFVSSVNLTEDTNSTGNVEIVPFQSWDGEIELERKDDRVLSGTVKVFARYIQDPIDRILFPDGSEGPGNLESAWRYGAEANLTWLLDSYGLNGMRFEVEGGIRDSSISDPVTNRKRQLNEVTKWNYELEFNHDIPNTPYAWGFYLEQFSETPFLRRDQSFDFSFDKPFSSIWVTHKDLLGMKVQLQVQNVLNWTANRERIIYEPDRTGMITGSERFARQRGRRVGIRISDTF